MEVKYFYPLLPSGIWPALTTVDIIEETRLVAESHGDKFHDLGNGHVQLRRKNVLVNYWPASRRKTAHRVGASAILNCSPEDAVKLVCSTQHPARAGSAASGSVNKRTSVLQSSGNQSACNPAGVRHLYKGERAPWEFSSLIMSEPDRLRVAAYLTHSAAVAAAGAIDGEKAKARPSAECTGDPAGNDEAAAARCQLCESLSRDLQAAKEALRAAEDALRFAERFCPCGARPESPDTHPHVPGCLVDQALRLARVERN